MKVRRHEKDEMTQNRHSEERLWKHACPVPPSKPSGRTAHGARSIAIGIVEHSRGSMHCDAYAETCLDGNRWPDRFGDERSIDELNEALYSRAVFVADYTIYNAGFHSLGFL
ncbi:unnamed protein product [Angiostrongylus costaricensis]|uniref:Ketoacyl_synth_N domain-containing protein n=1 Tax=Angiostrongylus costaricensis TaxID=334426 RepID=A0A0R3PPK7_ANGCS|nr:unnamed protein product [Angiostrongylus costaricensis]